MSPELSPRPMEPDPDRRHPRSFQLGDLLARMLLYLKENEECSAGFTHPLKYFVHQPKRFFLGELVGGQKSGRRNFCCKLLWAGTFDEHLSPSEESPAVVQNNV